MIKKLIAGVFALAFAFGAQAGDPIIKGVFVDASTGDYLGNVIHVEQDGGDDTTGDGTAAKPYATINKGLSVAVTGDTVLVGPGDYTDTVDVSCKSYGGTYYTIPTVAYINSKKVYLKSREGKSTTFITGKWGADSDGTGEGATRCVYINGSAAKGTVIDGFTIRNGAAPEHEYHASPTDGGGGISGAGDVGINNATGKSSAPYGYAVYCTIENCRAAQGAAISCGITAISCLFRGNVAANQSKHVGYRCYNTCNCIFEGNGNGSGHVIAASSASLSINDTYILNSCDTQIGAGSTGEPSFVYNCAFLANMSEPKAQAGRYATNCVSSAASGVYANSPNGRAGVSRYQVVSPIEEDYTPYTGANGKLVDAGAKDAWDVQVASWIPSDFANVDFYGNPRVVGDSIDVGAVERQDATVDSYNFVQINGISTKVTLGETVYRAKSGGGWFAQKMPPTKMYRVTVDLAEGEALYAYEVYGYKADLSQAFKVNMYPDSREDDGVYINPPNADVPFYSVEAKKTTSIKWCDPNRGDYTGADGSEEKPYETIQEAINAVAAGGVIYAKPGVYNKGTTTPAINVANDGQDTNSTPNRVYINKPLRLVSTGGAAVTTIEGTHDDSETGAYDGCGPRAVRCVLANQAQWCAIQGFTFKDGATDGDLAHRGRWDIKDNQPRFNSSDSIVRGNFGGGGVRASNYSEGQENCVVTDSVFTNCVGYWGGAIYGGLAQRCLFVGNTAVSHDPGSTYAPYGIAFRATLLGCIVRDNTVARNYVVQDSNARFSTLYNQSYNGAIYYSLLGDNTDPPTASSVVNAASGDFRLRSTATKALGKSCPKNESNFVRYSTSDFYGRPLMFVDANTCAAGAVQDIAVMLKIGSDYGSGVTADKTVLAPGESVTVAATGTRKFLGFKVKGEDVPPTNTVYVFTAPPLDIHVYMSLDEYSIRPQYAMKQDWFVDAVNGNDANDGWTAETAKKTLAAAMGVEVYSGETVHAAPGTYNEGTMMNPVKIITNDTSDSMPSRVVIPAGVALVATEGPDVTFIEGSPHSDTTMQGDNAVRGVYLYNGSRVEGFTIRKCYTIKGTSEAENSCGGCIVAPYMNTAANRENPGRIVNCVLTQSRARSGSGGMGGLYERCKFIDLVVNSGGVTMYGKFVNCFFRSTRNFDSSSNMSLFHSSYGIHSCSVAVSRNIAGDEDFRYVNAPIENSLIYYYGGGKATVLKNAHHCVVYATPTCGFTIDSTTCSNIITNNSSAAVFDANGCPVAGSPLINAGDNTLLDAYDDGKGDLVGNSRVVDGVVDIGCYEYQFNPRAHILATDGGIEPSEDFELVPGESKTIRVVDGVRHVSSFTVITNDVPVDLPLGTREYTWTPTAIKETLTVEVDYSTDWYVNANADDDSGNGFTPATAKKTLAGIMNAPGLRSGDTVHVAEGTYDAGQMKRTKAFNGGAPSDVQTQARVVIPAGVSLVASGARAKTIIKGYKDPEHPDYSNENWGLGPAALRCVEMYAGASLKGFTLTGGATRWLDTGFTQTQKNENCWGGGVMAEDNSCVIEDCTITDSHARYAGGAHKGTLRRCEIIHCAGSSSNGGVCGGKYYNCYFDYCFDQVVGSPQAFESCTIGPNCTLWEQAGNYMNNVITGAGSVPIRNCLILSRVSGRDTNTFVSVNSVWPDQPAYKLSSSTGSAVIPLADLKNIIDATTHEPLRTTASMVIDKGDNAFADGETDCAGNPRICNGTVDIGAYEYQPRPHAHVTATDNAIEPIGDFDVTLGEPVTVRATNGDRYVASFEVKTNGVLVVLPAGTREYTWTPTAVTDTLSIDATYSTDWYVNANAVDDSGNGFTPEAAKKTLVGIMAAPGLRSGDTVHAAPGDYNEGMVTNTTTTYSGFGFRGDGTRHPSRVIIPAGVSLVADEGPEKTTIWGKWNGATKSHGPNAIRAVYMMGNTRLEGFTVTHGAGSGHKDGSTYDDNCGGNIAAPRGDSAAPAHIVNCILIEGCARSGGAVLGGILEHCRIYDNYVTSDGVIYGSRLYHCMMYGNGNGNDARAQLRYHCGVYSCTVVSDWSLSGDADFTTTGNSTIENSILFFKNCSTATTLKNARNCIINNPAKITIDDATCSNLITNNVVTDIVKSWRDPHLVAGSPAIDAADEERFAAYYDGKGDCEYGQRVYNGKLDIGAYEYDWRPEYAKDLVSPDILVTEASPEVVETDGKNVSIPDGATVKLNWPGTGGSYEARFEVSGGTLTVTENGKEPVAYTEGGSYVVDAPTADTKLVFTYAGTGSATLLPFLGAYEAKIGTTPYTNFADAYAAVSGSDVITLLKKVTWTPAADVAFKTVPVDKGNFTLTIAPASVTAFNEKGYVCKFDDTTLKVGLPFGGSGTANDPYTIPDYETLDLFRKGVNAGSYGRSGEEWFKQVEDIDFADIDGNGTVAPGWTGIGEYSYEGNSEVSFRGVYDGNGKTIANLVFAPIAAKYQGLFNCVFGGVVTNLTVVMGDGDALRDANNNVIIEKTGFYLGEYKPDSPSEFGGAALLGCARNAKFYNCTAKGNIGGNHNVAGIIVRICTDVEFYDCVNEVNVAGAYTKVAGFASASQAGEPKLVRCVNKGNVVALGEKCIMSPSSYVGKDGVAGFLAYISSGAKITFENCSNSGTLQKDTENSGAILGSFVGCINDGYVNIVGENVTTAGVLAFGSMKNLVSPVEACFASVDGDVATFPATLALGGSYKVMAPLAAYNLQFTKNDVPRSDPIWTISFDRSLYAGFEPTVTPAVGVKVTGPAIEGDVLTYTVRRRMGTLMILQ